LYYSLQDRWHNVWFYNTDFNNAVSNRPSLSILRVLAWGISGKTGDKQGNDKGNDNDSNEQRENFQSYRIPATRPYLGRQFLYWTPWHRIFNAVDASAS